MPSSKELEARLVALRAEIKEVEQQEQKEREARQKALKKDWVFTIFPAEKNHGFDRLRAGSGVILYMLHGEVKNVEECKAVGLQEDRLRGGMAYYYNTLNNKFVVSSGGGSIFIADRDRFFSKSDQEHIERVSDADVVFARLEAFLTEHPEGGDVTEIILSQRHFGW